MMCSMSSGSILATVHPYSDTMAARSEWEHVIRQSVSILCIRSLVMELPHASIMEAELLKMIQAIDGEDIVQVQEFTSVLDRRELPETVGLIVEITGDIGMAPCLRSTALHMDTHMAGTGTEAGAARQRVFEALVSTNEEHQRAFDAGQLSLPTIRIVKPGTFRDYRRYRGEQLNTPVGQTKVPVVVTNPDVLAWLEERVAKELESPSVLSNISELIRPLMQFCRPM